MIYTVTFNPALDYIMNITDYKEGAVNRSQSEMYLPGGKGINVSIVLANMNIRSTALGFVGGFVGDEIIKRLDEFNVNTDFTVLQNGNSRINVKLKAQSETEINAAGPDIDECAKGELMNKLNGVEKGDFVVLAGSVPSGMNDSAYNDILKIVNERGADAVVDTTGSMLINTLEHRPFLIKPNIHELGELFEDKLFNDDEIIKAVYSLQQRGARNVLVSMGGNGAMFVGEDKSVIKHAAPQGRRVNTTGAGDSMVAGFLAGYIKSGELDEAFLMGIAAGSASAFSQYLATGDEILKIYNQIR